MDELLENIGLLFVYIIQVMLTWKFMSFNKFMYSQGYVKIFSNLFYSIYRKENG